MSYPSIWTTLFHLPVNRAGWLWQLPAEKKKI